MSHAPAEAEKSTRNVVARKPAINGNVQNLSSEAVMVLYIIQLIEMMRWIVGGASRPRMQINVGHG